MIKPCFSSCQVLLRQLQSGPSELPKAFLTQLVATWAILGPSWNHLVRAGSHFGAAWNHLGLAWASLETWAIIGQHGATFDRFLDAQIPPGDPMMTSKRTITCSKKARTQCFPMVNPYFSSCQILLRQLQGGPIELPKGFRNWYGNFGSKSDATLRAIWSPRQPSWGLPAPIWRVLGPGYKDVTGFGAAAPKRFFAYKQHSPDRASRCFPPGFLRGSGSDRGRIPKG